MFIYKPVNVETGDKTFWRLGENEIKTIRI